MFRALSLRVRGGPFSDRPAGRQVRRSLPEPRQLTITLGAACIGVITDQTTETDLLTLSRQ